MLKTDLLGWLQPLLGDSENGLQWRNMLISFQKKHRMVLFIALCWQFISIVFSSLIKVPLFHCRIYFYREQYSQAQVLIDSARDLLDTELTALSGESYQRAYGAMVSVQMLAELEEVIHYKILPERRSPIRKMWWQRLQVRSL